MPFSHLTLPTTTEELEIRFNSTYEYFKTHLPMHILVENPHEKVDPTTAEHYKSAFENVLAHIKEFGFPNPENYGFDFADFGEQNLDIFLAQVTIIETSLIHALVTGSISQKAYDTAGKRALCTYYTYFIFNSFTESNEPAVRINFFENAHLDGL